MGTIQTARTVTSSDNFVYRVEITVDDDPFTTGVQINNAKTLKEVTILITPQGANGNWVTAFQTKSVLRRERAN